MVLSQKPAAKRLTQTTTKERLTLEEARKIENWSERIFAIAVCSIPHLEVFHEPHAIKNGSGETLPDFLIKNTRRGEHASKVYVEVTKSPDLHRKNKQKQLMVMQTKIRHEEGVKYFQFPLEVIQRISCAKGIEVEGDVCAALKEERPARNKLSEEGQRRLWERSANR